MKLWNYIGSFFLFRWLFGKSDKPNIEHRDMLVDETEDSEELDDLDIFMLNNTPGNYRSDGDMSFDDFHEEQDDYDMLDDL